MLKKEILMVFKISSILVAAAMIISCATQKELGLNAKNVTIHINNSIPYCGGAAPTPEMEIPRLEPIKNYALLLYTQNDDGSRGAELKEIKTDESGKISLSLPSGKYQLWLPSKKLPLEEFIKIQSPNKGSNYIYKDKECFQAWKESPDFSFEVLIDTTISLAYRNSCYTDAHPCVRYDGPYIP